VPKKFHPPRIHVATRVFQALRIAVNTELENLARILDEAPAFLKPGARMCVISFHSLEDRMVKRKFRDNPDLQVLTTRPVAAGADELAANPRSRSAKLRVAERKDRDSTGETQ
jgi:16S rRNA (cytosine1402-N4)-methyltransferase